MGRSENEQAIDSGGGRGSAGTNGDVCVSIHVEVSCIIVIVVVDCQIGNINIIIVVVASIIVKPGKAMCELKNLK